MVSGFASRSVSVIAGSVPRGAFGLSTHLATSPTMRASTARQPTGPGPQQFNTPHGITVSNDGVVYVADRAPTST
jgi:hypothetical protein